VRTCLHPHLLYTSRVNDVTEVTSTFSLSHATAELPKNNDVWNSLSSAHYDNLLSPGCQASTAFCVSSRPWL